MENLRVVNWEFALLKQDPFLNTSAVWAGFKDLRNRFDSLFFDALTTSRAQVVLNMGEYGSGKTHAAVFYSNQKNLPDSGNEVAKKAKKNTRIFYIKTPKEPEKANELLYQEIIEAVKLRRFREVVRDIIKELGRQPALDKLQEVMGSDVLGRALWLLGLERDESGELTLFREDDASEEWQRLLEAYFFSRSTKTDLEARIKS